MTSPSDAPAPRVGPAVRLTWRWALVLAYMAAIYLASSLSGISLPARLSDKAAHAALYFVLSSLIVWALTDGDVRRVTGRTVTIATLASVLYGWTDELHQLFVPSRQYEWLDLLADATGAGLAATLLWAWGIIRRGSEPHDGV